MTENQKLGQQALMKSRSKILTVLLSWDFELHGEPTAEKLAKRIPMGKDTVNKHMKDFRELINEIKLKEQIRVDELNKYEQNKLDLAEKNRQQIAKAYAERKIKAAGL
jgi:hypothetical protein